MVYEETFSFHYDGWRQSRMNGLCKYVDASFFQEKTLLELGCGFGHLGYIFSTLGCKVTCSDVRDNHLEQVRQRYPDLLTKRFDCDLERFTEHYDIILHWGVLYHMNKNSVEEHLRDVLSHCDVCLLETEVCDSDDPNFFIEVNEHDAQDQAYYHVGCRLSPTCIEQIVLQCNFNISRIIDPILNSDFHQYDWQIGNTKTWKHGLRRFWICWNKDIPSPLKEN